MDSLEPLPFSHLICPAVRINYNKNFPRKNIGKNYFFQINNSYYFSNGGDEISSNYGHHLYPLYWCHNKEYSAREFWCGACQCRTMGTTYYFCERCDNAYHKECVESPPLIKSLYHPKHHLQLLQVYRFKFEDRELYCKHCTADCVSSYHHIFYHCFSCKFSLDPVCARKPRVLNYRKRHEHTLKHFPRKNDLICDVCGVFNGKSFIFVCLECDFVVHEDCIYLPFVIRISRHDHRISFTYSSPYTNLLCGVCRKRIDENYGAYTCKKGCIYAVHSKCATRKDVWDGKELEEEPEEEENMMSSFEVIGDGIIKHFSHSSHHMRLEKEALDNILYNEGIRCQACTLPLYDGGVYKCMNSKCDFVLHEACANLPQTKRHMTYPSPFTLRVSNPNRSFICHLCSRFSYGFRYVSYDKWKGPIMEVDVRCAAISEPFDHPCHIHPLFLTSEPGKFIACSMCMESRTQTLNCIECDFISCFSCATLPYKVRYKHDEHILTLSHASLSWCEICEETCNDTGLWLYTCNVCSITLHVPCILGRDDDIYIKPAQSVFVNGAKVNIVLNDGLTRPICDWCNKRWTGKIMYVTPGGRIFCHPTEVIPDYYALNLFTCKKV